MSTSWNREYRRAVVVGGGINGLSAATFLARAGWQVQVFEQAARVGGAARSAAVFGADTIVDLGAAAHPFGAVSPAFSALGLEEFGLEFVHSDYPLAHPLPGRPAALLHRSLEATAAALGVDKRGWYQLHRHLVAHLDAHLANALSPLMVPPLQPAALLRFAPIALPSATTVGHLCFREQPAKALLAGNAVHAIAPPSQPLTAAFGTLFAAIGMTHGWPVAKGGSQSIVDALTRAAVAAGVKIHTNAHVSDVHELPEHEALILNLAPARIVRLAGVELSGRARRQLKRWRSGPGVYKVDYLLSQAPPWRDPRVGQATTVHVCGTAADIDIAERQVRAGRMPRRPFVMLCQQQVADPGRAQRGFILWAYAHVPHNYQERYPGEVAELIEQQIERFAPGFRDTIVTRNLVSPQQLQALNPNLIGGDIAVGAMSGSQVLFRPGIRANPYRIGPRTYLASAAAPPGAGVHGMVGAHVAHSILRTIGGADATATRPLRRDDAVS